VAVLTLACLTLAASETVGPVPDALRQRLDLAPFYQKHLDADGLPIVASYRVADAALHEAAWIVRHMIGHRPDLIRSLADQRARVAIMAWCEYTTDLPEQAAMEPKVFWDRRARGLGGTPRAPIVSCAEENLLDYPGDPYSTENIFIHEFAHTLHGIALRAVDPTFVPRLEAAYKKAIGQGLWKGTYAGSNPDEYWAEAVQDWYDDNRENDALHNAVNTRAELEAYDPDLARLCAEVLGEGPWRYRRPRLRTASDRAHLVGYDPARSPRFVWRDAPLVPQPRVLIQTEWGDIEAELDADRAPVTVRNFLRYAHEGLYSDGVFHRTVTLGNQADQAVKIEVIQASANPARGSESHPPIPLERTRDTGLSHRAGTLSMARDGPDSATHEFFICVADQPELDFGGGRNADGQGFAAFGRVTRGMEIVRRIHRAPAQGQTLAPPVRIQRLIRTR